MAGEADLEEIEEIMDKATHPDAMSQEEALDFFESVEVAASVRADAIREDMG